MGVGVELRLRRLDDRCGGARRWGLGDEAGVVIIRVIVVSGHVRAGANVGAMGGVGGEGDDAFGGLFLLEDGCAVAADGLTVGGMGFFLGELHVADGALGLGGEEERLLGRFSVLPAVGAEVIAVFVLGMAGLADIDAADETDLGEAGGYGDQRAAVVALALAAEEIFRDLGRFPAARTADAEGQRGTF